MKFTIILTPKQEKTVESLRDTLGATTKAMVFQKALALALLYKEAIDEGNQFLIADKSGNVVERLKII